MRRVDAPELMDADDLPLATYAAVVGDLARVNRATLAYRPTLSFLARAAARRSALKLLDVGFGDGDMLRRIARWAAKRGLAVELTGVDLNSRSAPAAEAHESATPIRYITGDYADLGREPWDVVISSLVAHHMTRDQLIQFLRWVERHARVGWFVNDLHRHRAAHLGWPLLAHAARWHPIVRHDGRVSIARSFRPDDWRAILAEAGVGTATVRRHFPFRLCVAKIF